MSVEGIGPMSGEKAYRERYRPQFHFTSRANWLNDPNGCVFHDGYYHLFFQHNPLGVQWGHMSWGHAVSTDLVHWRQVEQAIRPYDGGTIFSGSAVVDAGNDSKLGTGSNAPLVAAFTHARKPFGQAIAFSNDRGATWNLYDGGRHVVPNQGLDEGERDPRLFRHEPSGKWIMVLWVRRGQVRVFVSDDLLKWEHAGDFHGEGLFECPDLFQLPVDGDARNAKWVLHDAGFHYWIGSFDGKAFSPDAGPFQGDWGGNFYAAQTWNNTGSRVIQIGWMRGGEYPGMPFNQQMSFPCELSLRTTPRGVRLCRIPIGELASLQTDSESVADYMLKAGGELAIGSPGDLFDVDVEVDVPSGGTFCVRLAGQDIIYHEGRIRCLGREADLPPDGDTVSMRMLVDRTSIELFGNDGEVSMSTCFLSQGEIERVRLLAGPTRVRIRACTVCRLSSAWEPESCHPSPVAT